MRRPILGLIAVTWVLAACGATAAEAQVVGASGSDLFTTYCASCHGTTAKGDGPVASSLNPKPADLTQIAKKNGGSFPAEQVQRTVDGRTAVKEHGGSSMPVWGDAFAKSGADSMSPDEKIRRLVRYLETIQQK